MFDKYIPSRVSKREDASDEPDGDSNNNECVQTREAEEVKPAACAPATLESKQPIKTWKSQLMLSQKPLSKHFSLPPNFKIHPSSELDKT